jgi:energy-coupling factor transport system permease protein
MIDPRRLSIGRYLPIETYLHQVDARTKIICSTGLVVVLFVSGSWQGWVIGMLGLLVTCVTCGIPSSYLLGNLRSLLPILILTFGLNAYMTPGAPAWDGSSLTDEGLVRGGILCLRLITIVTLTSLLSLTTSPLELADGLQSLLAPLSRLRIPIHELALTATIALRLIPLLADEATRIRTAQLARGARTRGSLTRRIKDLSAILIPLFAAAFGRAERLADAMSSRGYKGAEGRTRYHDARFGRADLVAFTICIAFTIGALLLSVG